MRIEPSGRNAINTRSKKALENQPKNKGRKVVEIIEESDEESSESEEEIPVTADFKSMRNPPKKIGCLYLLVSAEGWDPSSSLHPLSRIHRVSSHYGRHSC